VSPVTNNMSYTTHIHSVPTFIRQFIIAQIPARPVQVQTEKYDDYDRYRLDAHITCVVDTPKRSVHCSMSSPIAHLIILLDTLPVLHAIAYMCVHMCVFSAWYDTTQCVCVGVHTHIAEQCTRCYTQTTAHLTQPPPHPLLPHPFTCSFTLLVCTC
jgi:hypothetical protein